MSRFHIEDFKNIYENLDNKELNNEIYEILINISKEINCKILFPRTNNNDKYINNFKHTQIKSIYNNELKYIQNIKKIFNKITNNNYMNFNDDILININEVKNNFNDKYENFCIEIYKLLNNNLLYNKSFSYIFKNLINNDIIFYNILNEDIKNFNNIFDNLNYMSPEINYDDFCDYNKNNEIRRCKILFFSNLFLIDIISLNSIVNIINILIEKFNNLILSDNKKNEAYEITECIYIIIKNTFEKINKIDSKIYSNILTNITDLSKLKISNYKSLTNKCNFKFLNIIDELY